MSIESVGMVRGPQIIALIGSNTCHSSRTALNKKFLDIVTLLFGSDSCSVKCVNQNMAFVYKGLVLYDLGKLENKNWCLFCAISFWFWSFGVFFYFILLLVCVFWFWL